MFMMTLIPWPYRILAIALLIAAVGGYGFTKGYQMGHDKGELELQNYVVEATKKYITLEKKQSQVTEKVVTEYVDKIVYVTKWRTKNVNIAQNNVVDNNILSNGWVQVHDDSARGRDADPTTASDGTPSGIDSSEALSGIVNNYGICRENSERLLSLQTWIAEQKQLVEGINSKNGKQR